jgi:hypothetical protein
MPVRKVELQRPVLVACLGMLAEIVSERHMREPTFGAEFGDVQVVG